MNRVNIGCGTTAIKDWINYDNYIRFIFPTNKLFVGLVGKIGLLDEVQREFIESKRRGKVKRVNVLKGIPLKDNSMEVVYGCHVIEHLDPREVPTLLSESFRILEHRGILRLVMPDLEKISKRYVETGDGDEFISSTGLARPKSISFKEKIKHLINGFKHHRWLYDEKSLKKLLAETGFIQPVVLQPGETTITNPGDLNLSEKGEAGLSLFIEAQKP